MGFSIVVGRNRHYSCSIWVPVSVSSIPLNGTLYTITDQYSAEYLRGAHHISPECSVYTALSCLALCSANSLPWSPLTISSISSTKIVCWALPWFLLPELCPGNSLQAVSCDSCRTHLTCFLSQTSLAFNSACGAEFSEPLFHTFCLFFSFVLDR